MVEEEEQKSLYTRRNLCGLHACLMGKIRLFVKHSWMAGFAGLRGQRGFLTGN